MLFPKELLSILLLTALICSSVEGFSSSRRRRCSKARDDNGLPCKVKLSHHASAACKIRRNRELQRKKIFYKLSSPTAQSRYPAPVLDQPKKTTRLFFMTDPFTAHWFNLYYFVLLKATNANFYGGMTQFKMMNNASYENYIQIYNVFSNMVKKFQLPQYFKKTSTHELYENMVRNKTWSRDSFFAQQRLAGMNPLSMEVVSLDGGIKWNLLKQSLNGKFNWKKELQHVIGKRYSLKTMLRRRLFYVLQFPSLHDISKYQDMTKTTSSRKMKKDISPMAIFAVCKKSSCNGELQPVAIQIDYKKDSPVYTPRDGYRWELAKAQVQLAELLVTQMKDHLARTHLRLEPICVGINRHLSAFHPLFQILKFHCRALIPVNNNGISALLDEGANMDKLTAMGANGTKMIFSKAFEEMVWGDNDFWKDIERRGLDDKEALPYFPYRDDGEILAYVVYRFSQEFVELYYKRDSYVSRDFELQNLLNEISAEGRNPPDGGKGKIKGLQSRFKSRYQLEKFLELILWTIIQHSAINYPILDYGGFVPNMPAKLYECDECQDMLSMLPGGIHAAIQASMAHSLGSLHYDELFDYSSQLNDAKARKLVHKYYKILTEHVKPKLDRRNRLRVKTGKLSYPYLVPGIIPNSIST